MFQSAENQFIWNRTSLALCWKSVRTHSTTVWVHVCCFLYKFFSYLQPYFICYVEQMGCTYFLQTICWIFLILECCSIKYFMDQGLICLVWVNFIPFSKLMFVNYHYLQLKQLLKPSIFFHQLMTALTSRESGRQISKALVIVNLSLHNQRY